MAYDLVLMDINMPVKLLFMFLPYFFNYKKIIFFKGYGWNRSSLDFKWNGIKLINLTLKNMDLVDLYYVFFKFKLINIFIIFSSANSS